jgi:hypothetical protein
VQAGTFTFWAGLRLSGPKEDHPLVFTVGADKMPLVHLVLTSMNSQRPAVDQAVRRFAAGGFQDITERLAGDAHFFRGFFMIQAFEVR